MKTPAIRKLRQKLAASVPTYGLWVTLESPSITEMAVALGFDWIVIDSPPVMVASDATSLANVATAVVFVVGSQMTTARQARAALEQLDGAQHKIIGAVLSRADTRWYSPYYRSSHKQYYLRKRA